MWMLAFCKLLTHSVQVCTSLRVSQHLALGERKHSRCAGGRDQGEDPRSVIPPSGDRCIDKDSVFFVRSFDDFLARRSKPPQKKLRKARGVSTGHRRLASREIELQLGREISASTKCWVMKKDVFFEMTRSTATNRVHENSCSGVPVLVVCITREQ